MLQFITNSPNPDEVLAQTERVLEGGCRWIQLRMKDLSKDILRDTLMRLIPLCNSYGATLIVDDHVEMAAYKGVAGVHLGANDMDPAEARRLLGSGKIIGLTVNTFDDVVKAADKPVDYYGVGPWRFTTTKKALAPVLGPHGVSEIVRRLKTDRPDRAIVVIGGVTADDIDAIMATGADGPAISGYLADSSGQARTREIIKKLS